MTKIKRKQLVLDIENAPDGYYGIFPGGNVPDVQPGDQLELAIDKIIEVIDRMAPQLPPKLVDISLSISESLDGPVGPTGVNDLSGNPVFNVYRFVDGALLTYTTSENPLNVGSRNGHFAFDAIDSAILRFRHVYKGSTKIVDVNYLETLINPPLDNVSLQTDTTDGYNITTDILEFRDFYADDPALAPSRSGFYNSIKSENTVQLLSGANASDTELRQVYLEYSMSGLFDDTVLVNGAPYEYRLEDTLGSNMAPASVSLTNIPTMLGLVSGVPSLITGDTIKVLGQVDNGIKKYYPTIIATSSVTATDNINDTLNGNLAANSIWHLVNGLGTTHTFKVNQYSESIAGSVLPYDIFGAGTAQSATTLNNVRIDTKSLALALTDSTTRYLSPATNPVDSTQPWTVGLSGGVGGYDMTAHQSSLDTTATFGQALQILNGLYQYPIGDYTGYIGNIGAGPNYTNGTTNFPLGQFRYIDIELGTINNVTGVILQFNAANWNAQLPTGLQILLRVEGASPTGGDGWLNIMAAYQGGNPTGSNTVVGSGMARDAYVFSDPDSSADGRRRRVTFGSAPKIGNVIVRIGIQQGSGFNFQSITLTSV